MNSSLKARNSLLGAAALLLLAVPAFAAEPADATAARAAAESEQKAALARADAERQLAAAQQKLEASVREVEQLSQQLGAQVGSRFGGPPLPPRAMLGVQVRSADAGAGAYVMAVSPGGPAQAAGIKEGDVITAIDGKDLTKGPDAGRALAEAMVQQQPDRKVKVKVTRDGKAREVEVAVRPPPRGVAWYGPNGSAVHGVRYLGPAGAPPGPFPMRGEGRDGNGPQWERGVPLAGMELATLSERLGGYFGTKEGVLVVRAGNNDAYQLQDGDILLAIDGREPNSASHATRILRSYQRGEKLQLKILRERKPMTLAVTLPGG